jgi:hypothetical protein
MAATAGSLRNEIAQELDTLPVAQLRKVREYVGLLRLSPLVGKVAPDQAWFWTEEWQAKERAAEKAIAEGRVRTFDTMDGMLEFLDAQ